MRVALVCDYLEEQWPSMDLVGDMVFDQLRQRAEVNVSRIRPAMRRRFARVSHNADRLVNRFWDYPRLLRGSEQDFDLFHIVDHSYAHLINALPSQRAIVTCHDIDAFRSLLEPVSGTRCAVLREMAKRLLRGLRRAAHIVCVSDATRDELLRHALAAPEKLSVNPNGVHPGLSPEADPKADEEAARLLPRGPSNAIELLHVGSTIPRKRIDVLLRVFHGVLRARPEVRLVRIGGAFTDAQSALADDLGVRDSIFVMPPLNVPVLAAFYRRAALVLQTSEREGFGLPVAEAQSCATPVVASDLPVLREVGGDAATYCPVADIEAWIENILLLLDERAEGSEGWDARRCASLRNAAQFSWSAHVARLVSLYREVLA